MGRWVGELGTVQKQRNNFVSVVITRESLGGPLGRGVDVFCFLFFFVTLPPLAGLL